MTEATLCLCRIFYFPFYRGVTLVPGAAAGCHRSFWTRARSRCWLTPGATVLALGAAASSCHLDLPLGCSHGGFFQDAMAWHFCWYFGPFAMAAPWSGIQTPLCQRLIIKSSQRRRMHFSSLPYLPSPLSSLLVSHVLSCLVSNFGASLRIALII